ncbi:Acyl-CoA N-acyltransferases (Nat) [Glarea lozoyensis ATCC 20868]|uniref:Acyl-CoA N-acyltransferases (Nat) n=1 Tax=Glarea lozoyensis (strain ATCC 20868 / MF5171) TaxID=1116229 RepID=S3D0G8_GLAL2|nr:Acyl-CoA N-acyltransferases (Nat) [Glarea lozoyensis ATCC 20868]EPE31340.1 Acyl-CoA N-acyltransferases (Nat) [Glarea lozoyensis ATCC 20868]
MPRDLDLDLENNRERETASPPTLSESPNRMSGPSSPEPTKAFTINSMSSSKVTGNLHPYVRPLTISDLDSCEALENSAFSEVERASREKLRYRLTKCGELCIGLFTTVVPSPKCLQSPTLGAARLVESCRDDGAVSVMLGHVVSSKTTSPTCTDASMDYPKDWESTIGDVKKGQDDLSGHGAIGHQEQGRTVVLHSVAIAPGFQGRGMGGVLMKSYISSIAGSGVADRLALLAHEEKVEWYEKLGFVSKGPSAVKGCGGNWIDMVYEVKKPEARARYG